MPFSESILPEFDDEMKNTRKLLACIPDGKFDYKPHPKSMTLGRLASHVAELPGWTNVTLDQEILELEPGTQANIAASRAELLAIFDKGVAQAREKITAASDEHWQGIWTFKYDGKTIISMPRSTVMRSTILNHLYHHRGQLGVFLRLNDVEIPGMYGPSADEKF
jgi:uncharacterized damage-inducible protein DinB